MVMLASFLNTEILKNFVNPKFTGKYFPIV